MVSNSARPAYSGAYIFTICGEKITPNTVSKNKKVIVNVNNLEIKALPPSESLNDLTICGTKTAVNAPPISRLYKMLGIVFATLYVSPNMAVPSKATISKLRINPVILETTVPAAITVVARNNCPSDIFSPPYPAPTLYHGGNK